MLQPQVAAERRDLLGQLAREPLGRAQFGVLRNQAEDIVVPAQLVHARLQPEPRVRAHRERDAARLTPRELCLSRIGGRRRGRRSRDALRAGRALITGCILGARSVSRAVPQPVVAHAPVAQALQLVGLGGATFDGLLQSGDLLLRPLAGPPALNAQGRTASDAGRIIRHWRRSQLGRRAAQTVVQPRMQRNAHVPSEAALERSLAERDGVGQPREAVRVDIA